MRMFASFDPLPPGRGSRKSRHSDAVIQVHILNQIQQLSSSPANSTSLKTTVSSAVTVANAFNMASTDLSQLRQGLDQSISSVVGEANALAKQIADLNKQIEELKKQG